MEDELPLPSSIPFLFPSLARSVEKEIYKWMQLHSFELALHMGNDVGWERLLNNVTATRWPIRMVKTTF